MVKILRSRPSERLTFSYLTSLVSIPNCDAKLIGAMADFRPDLFVVTKDKKLKLRMNVAEDIARQGVSKWRVPAPPAKVRENAGLGKHSSGMSLDPAEGCYCNHPDEEVLRDLKKGSIPDEALVFSYCWKNICRVRGLFFNLMRS
jgi:hypothetical protein